MNGMKLGHTIDYHNTVNTTSLRLQLVNTILYGLYYTYTDIINSFEPYSKTIILVVHNDHLVQRYGVVYTCSDNMHHVFEKVYTSEYPVAV